MSLYVGHLCDYVVSHQFSRDVWRYVMLLVKIVLSAALHIFHAFLSMSFCPRHLYPDLLCGCMCPLVAYGQRVVLFEAVISDSIVTLSQIMHLLSCVSFFLQFPNLCWIASIIDLSFCLCAVGHH